MITKITKITKITRVTEITEITDITMISIGNSIISSAITDKQARVSF